MYNLIAGESASSKLKKLLIATLNHNAKGTLVPGVWMLLLYGSFSAT